MLTKIEPNCASNTNVYNFFLIHSIKNDHKSGQGIQKRQI